MSENSAKIQTETIPSSKFPEQRLRGAMTTGFDADNDSELIMGSVFGLRGWDQDALGRLVPVSVGNVPFTPGVNTATCSHVSSSKYFLTAEGKTAVRKGHRPPTIRDHSMAKCSCGYYAYFDNSSADSRHGTVGGIVEGTGLAVIGEKGFRVEKAELKALIVGSRDSKKTKRRSGFGFWSWFAKWVLPSNASLKKNKNFGHSTYRGDITGWFLALFILSGVASLGLTVASIFTEVEDPTSGSILWPFLALAAFGIFFSVSRLNLTEGLSVGDNDIYVSSTRGGPTEVRLFKKDVTRNDGDPNDPFSVARLKKLYPDVPVYYSSRAAQKDFPLTSVADFVSPPSDLPTPETADDFWNLRDDKY